MEWLINRRRMMFNKSLPIAYLGFNDDRAWEILCYNFGDVKKVINEEIAHGTITCDGTELVSSDYVFASCLNMPARQLSNGTTQTRVSAAAQTFKIEITFDSSTPFSDVSGDVIRINQYNSTITKSPLLSVAKEDITLDSGNKYTTTVQATNACQYLTVTVKANTGVSSSWKIIPISGNYQPIGITKKQCDVVTTIGYILSNNSLIHDLRQLSYFPLTEIGRQMCDYCTNLQYITIPDSVTSIGNYAFRSTALITLVLPDSVTTMGFSSCSPITTLTSVTFSKNLTTVSSFAGCTNLESDMIIPDGVTVIPDQIITNTKVSKIVLPDTVTSIERYAFSYPVTGTPYTHVYLYARTPPTLGSSIFLGNNNYTVYVPADVVDTYKAASGWSTYADHIEAIVEE